MNSDNRYQRKQPTLEDHFDVPDSEISARQISGRFDDRAVVSNALSDHLDPTTPTPEMLKTISEGLSEASLDSANASKTLVDNKDPLPRDEYYQREFYYTADEIGKDDPVEVINRMLNKRVPGRLLKLAEKRRAIPWFCTITAISCLTVSFLVTGLNSLVFLSTFLLLFMSLFERKAVKQLSNWDIDKTTWVAKAYWRLINPKQSLADSVESFRSDILAEFPTGRSAALGK